MEKMHKIKSIEWRNVLTQLNRKWIEKENLSIQSLSRLMLMKESLGMQEVKKRFLEFFFFFLWHGKVNMRTTASMFYKSTASANIKSATFGTVL